MKKFHESFYMEVNPTEHIQQQLFWYGHYEKELGDIITMIIKPGDVLLDIGANIGYFSLLASARQPTSKVVAFEPVKEIFQKLRYNISLNNIKNIITVNTAVGEMREEKDIFLSDKDNLGMSSFQQPKNFSGKVEKVKTITIDDWFKISGLHKIDIIKIDIEGSELDALKGMKSSLENFKPLLLIEINPETLLMFNLKANDIFDYLSDLNFYAYEISKNSELVKRRSLEVEQTKNYLFIHRDKKQMYSELLRE